MIKSLSSDTVKFGICGIGRDLTAIIDDHASVERLLEEGALHVRPMPNNESMEIVRTANRLFKSRMVIENDVAERIAKLAEGYPYLVQMFGKACVSLANETASNVVDMPKLEEVLSRVKNGRAFPTLESAYQRAVGASDGRKTLFHLLAEQDEDNTMFNDEVGKVVLKAIRSDAKELGVDHVDQLIPRLVDRKYGPALVKIEDRPGVYEFLNPILRVYVRLREF